MATVGTESVPLPVTEDTNGDDKVENEVENEVEELPSPVVHGKRERKTVKAFVASPPPTQKKSIEFEVGTGTVLGDIDIVTEYMAKTTSDHYSALHRVLFGVVGVALHRKKNIRRFNGYNFDKDSKQYEAKLASIRKLKSVDRKQCMKLVGLNQNTTVADFMDFLVCPTDKGRHVPQKNKGKTPQKRKRSADSKSKGSPKKKKAAKKRKPKTPEKHDDTDDDVSLSASEESENEDESAVKKRKVSEVYQEDVKESPKGSPKKKKAPRKRKPKTPEKHDDTDDDVSLSVSEESEDEEESAEKKRKVSEDQEDVKEDEKEDVNVKEDEKEETDSALPTDAELVGTIKKVMEGIDLEEVSMKQALAMVHDKYPGQDLTVKKSFIKENIRKEIEKG